MSARILTFPQAIRIILGTNIGTIVDAEIITLDIDSVKIPMSVVGAIFSI
ncbi:Na/Pi symporter [Bacillus sp. SA1-12]